jgi:transposase-like protein
MSTCPYCHDTEKQVKAGKNESGSQRYKCKPCQRRYTPEPSQMYSDAIRRQAMRLYADGLGFRQVARHLGVDNADQLAHAPLHIVEMDELLTFIGEKKPGLTGALG